MKNTFVSPSDAKYKSGRMSLLLIVILSAVNLISIVFAEMYFLFSAYVPQLLISIGYGLYFETEEMFYLIVAGVLGLITIIPYLLCWIFSKKHVGWMIAALVFFSMDSLLFLVDFAAYLAAGDYTMIFDLLIRIWAIVSLILGVKYGIQAKKEPPVTAEAVYEEPSEFQRTMTVTRKKSFAGSAVPLVCYVNGKEVCQLKNGETKSFSVTENTFTLDAMLSNGFSSSSVNVPAGMTAVSYDLVVKIGLTAGKILITPAAK